MNQTYTQIQAIRAYEEIQRDADLECTDPPLPAMIAWAVIGLALWAFFGWFVVRGIPAIWRAFA